LNINLCVKFVTPLIFRDIERVKIRLFNKSNGVSFMYQGFIYVTIGTLNSAATRPLHLGHFYNESIPITAVR